MQDTGPENGKNAGWYEAEMPGSLAQLLPLGRLPGSLARGFARLGSLARLADIWTAPGSLARFTSKKFLRFFISQELFLTQSPSRPIEAHRGFFHCAIWLDAGTFDSKISYRPANKLTDTARNCLFPCFQHWFRPQQAYFTKYSLINPST